MFKSRDKKRKTVTDKASQLPSCDVQPIIDELPFCFGNMRMDSFGLAQCQSCWFYVPSYEKIHTKPNGISTGYDDDNTPERGDPLEAAIHDFDMARTDVAQKSGKPPVETAKETVIGCTGMSSTRVHDSGNESGKTYGTRWK